MTFAGAGHPPAMIVTPGEQPRLLESRSMVLGGLPDAVADEAAIEMDLNPGDRVVLYTDGIIEAANAGGEDFGYERVGTLLQASARMAAEEAADLILNTVSGWSSSQSDDLTVIVCDYKRANSGAPRSEVLRENLIFPVAHR